MITGFILGKFHPLHRGHLGLIHFALTHCDKLIILLCASDKEFISGKMRLEWLQQSFPNQSNIEIILFDYLETMLPNTSVSSRIVSKIWANQIQSIVPQIDVIFTSERYGDYLAEYLDCKHVPYEFDRTTHATAASHILTNPWANWDDLAPAARPFFVKKICICGTESTGKSTLTERLAKHYKTNFVAEVGRQIVPKTEVATEVHLEHIALLHAEAIQTQVKTANKLLFVDTDVRTTQAYSMFLFGKTLEINEMVKGANQFEAHLFLGKDAPFIQDGTRLNRRKRNQLEAVHRKTLDAAQIPYQMIEGNWENRFEKAVEWIDTRILV
jgi:HTH-type transcriptional regulator, transcriptional repressor of NAD biosynthesis genes